MARLAGTITRYTPLLVVGEAQAWLAQRFRTTESAWTRTWVLALWVPLRALLARRPGRSLSFNLPMRGELLRCC